MTDYIIAFFCFLDDYLKYSGYIEYKNKKIYDAKIIATAFNSKPVFYKYQQATMKYMASHQEVQMIDKSGFNRHLHGLSYQLKGIFKDL